MTHALVYAVFCTTWILYCSIPLPVTTTNHWLLTLDWKTHPNTKKKSGILYAFIIISRNFERIPWICANYPKSRPIFAPYSKIANSLIIKVVEVYVIYLLREIARYLKYYSSGISDIFYILASVQWGRVF